MSYLAPLLLFAAIIALYQPSIAHPYFILDDLHHEERLRQLANLSLFELFTSGKTGMPIFIGVLTFFYRYFGDVNYIALLRIFNLMIHFANGVLLYSIATRLFERFPTYRPSPLALITCFLGVLLFIVHPLQVESLVWIASLKGTMAILFGLLAFWLKLQNFPLKWRPLQYSLVFSFYFLGLLSKPALIALPLVFLLDDLLFLKRPLRPSLALNLGFLLPSLFVGLFHLWTYTPWLFQALLSHFLYPFYQLAPIQYSIPLVFVGLILIILALFKLTKNRRQFRFSLILLFSLLLPIAYFKHVITLFNNLFVSLSVFLFSLFKILIPYPLSLDYGLNPFFLQDTYSLGFRLVFLSFILLSLLYFRRSKILPFLAVLYLIAFPYLGFFTFEFSYISYFADRFAYPLLAALVLFVPAFIATTDSALTKALAATLTVACVVSMILTAKQIPLWSDSETILHHSLEQNPKSTAMRLALASTYEANLQPELASRYYKEAIHLSSEVPETYLSLMYHYFREGKLEELIRFKEALAVLVPTLDRRVFPLVAQAYTSLGDYDRAEFYARLSLVYNPKDRVTRDLLLLIQDAKRSR